MYMRAVIQAAVILSTVFSARIGADVVVLTDGRTIRGEVLSEDRYEVELRHREGDTWTTTVFSRRDVEAVYDEPGDQSDGVLRRSDGDSRAGDREGSPRAASNVMDADRTIIAYVPLRGPVGGADEDGGFDAPLVESCFQAAAESGASVVILDIESPGGLVDEMEGICELILDWRDRFQIVAWPGEAFSAAAIMTMCCPEIVVRETSLFGSATIVTVDGETITPLEAKMASPHYARQRQYMQQLGKPYEVVEAMTRQAAVLWWSDVDGFASSRPDVTSGWREVDSEETILTVTASDAVRWELARGPANELDAVVDAVSDEAEPSVLDLSDHVERYRRSAARTRADVKQQFERYLRGLGQVNVQLVALFEARKAGDEDRAVELKRAVLRELGQVRAAGRAIARARRTQHEAPIPEEMADRVEADADLLAQVAAGLRTELPQRWNAAAQELGRVLRAWRDLTIRE